jgi:signal transduction histidine kinase
MALATGLMKINNFRTKLKSTLKTKIIIWFVVITLICLILYGLLLFYLFKFNIQGNRHLQELKNNPDIDRMMIENIEKINKRPRAFMFPPPLTVLPPLLMIRVFFILSGGVLVIIIISTSGGFLFFKRSLDQIEFITNSVREIDEKRLHIRLKLRGKDVISKMAATFDSMLDKIENSFKHQKQFIQNASHELNTPLTVIKTKIDVLKQKKAVTGKECMETLELIDGEIMRLSKITEELLTLSDLEENSNMVEFIQVNVKKVLEKMLRLFKNQISSKNLDLKTCFDGVFEVLGVVTQIEQLLFNLLDNAIKYSSYKSELAINLINDNERKNLIFSITNTSEAIKKEDIPYIFDRFYKTSINLGEKGFGLGLSISKKIVENHNGIIEVNYDEVKKAITFKIFLPLLKKNKESI